MENTTKMYIEHVVIGMQTTIILFFGFVCIKPGLLQQMKEISAVMELVVVLPIAYALGILVDRISKYAFFSEKKEETVKQEECKKVFGNCLHEMEPKDRCKECERNYTSREVWKKFDEMEYYQDAMARKRILRATFFNSSAASVLMTVLLLRGFLVFNYTVIALFIVLLVVAVASYITYKHFLIEYYKKQKKYTEKILPPTSCQ